MTKTDDERDFPPLSSGAVLQERIVGRLGLSQAALAKALGVSRFTVNQVLGELNSDSIYLSAGG